MEKSSGVRVSKSMKEVSSAIITKPSGKIESQKKVFEDFKKLLEKLKVEFEERYKMKVEKTCDLSDFDFIVTLGNGSFGSVVLSKMKISNKCYAIKIMSKAKIVKNKQIDHTRNERDILQAIKFNFVLHLEYSFKDNCSVFFVLPFIQGGDMFTYLRRVKFIKEKDVKFYAAQILLALEYLHYLDLLYRDLKPENIVIDAPGYIKLADFGFCKLVKTRTYTLCGTPEYIAPEIILSKGYGKSADWWAFGVLIYEMLVGYTPFYAQDLMQIYEKITVGRFKYPPTVSGEARSLLRNILQTDLSKRYGILKNGVMDIKGHDWFKIIDWQAIYTQRAAPPFVPKLSGVEDTSYFDKFDSIYLEESATDKFSKEFEDF